MEIAIKYLCYGDGWVDTQDKQICMLTLFDIIVNINSNLKVIFVDK